MDLSNYTRLDLIRGYQALRENPFFVSLLAGLEHEVASLRSLVEEGTTLNVEVPEHFRTIGRIGGILRIGRALDLTIAGLLEEEKQEQEGQTDAGRESE
jgi:hypothetical protein